MTIARYPAPSDNRGDRRLPFACSLVRSVLVIACLGLGALRAAAPSRELLAALATFRTEGPAGWSYTQTTQSAGETLVERFDPARPEILRWSLVERNGRAPSAEETEDYRQGKVRRSSAWNAPRLEQQINRESCEVVSSDAAHQRCRFRLKPDDSGDAASEHLAVIVSLHLATGCIDEVEIVNLEPFSPVFGIKIAESRTVLTYSLPEGDKPSLLVKAALRVRGRAFWIKAIEQDMVVLWQDHRRAGPAPGAAAAR